MFTVGLAELHGHRVLELVVDHRPPHLPRARVEREDQPVHRGQRLLGREVEHDVAVAVARLGRVQEAHAEVLAHPAEPGQERAGRSGQRLRGGADVHLAQGRRVDPDGLAVGDDLLGRRVGVLPAQLAALLQIDGALGGDALVQALVERGLGELGLEVVDLAVGGLQTLDHLVERGRRWPGPGPGRGAPARRARQTRVRASEGSGACLTVHEVLPLDRRTARRLFSARRARPPDGRGQERQVLGTGDRADAQRGEVGGGHLHVEQRRAHAPRVLGPAPTTATLEASVTRWNIDSAAKRPPTATP